MKATEMMEKISKTLKQGEVIEVRIAHQGNWNGASVYEITSEGYKYINHKWQTNGNLRDTYSKLVLNKA
jgi:hypothetical protein